MKIYKKENDISVPHEVMNSVDLFRKYLYEYSVENDSFI